MNTDMIGFRAATWADAAVDRLSDAAGLDRADVERIAVACGLYSAEQTPATQADGRERALRALDLSPPLFEPVLAGQATAEDRPLTDLAREALERGLVTLESRLRALGGDWDRLVDNLSGDPSKTASIPRETMAVEVPIGATPDGTSVTWTVNQESDRQSCANARFAGAPGVGKSQVLLHLLWSVSRACSAGFVLLDYKGDLASDAAFVKGTQATVIRPEQAPVPMNPFELPGSSHRRLAPRAYAEAFASLAPGIGAVQVDLLTRAMERAWQRADGSGGGCPTLAAVSNAVTEVYEESRRGIDTVTSRLRDLAEHGLFAEHSARPPIDAFSVRWVVDLSQLAVLREFVAVVLLEHLHQVARALPDSSFDARTRTRALRGIVAVDEAHYYLAGPCDSLFGLIRVGRSKGIPVWLSSQSLEDFRTHTELNEFLPNTFVFRHGVAPDGRTLAGALRVPTIAAARRIAERTTTLSQMEAMTPFVANADGPQGVRMIPFYKDKEEAAR